MNPGLIVKLRPSSPWRIGPSSGERERVDLIYHSDTLFSAVTHAMRLLGRMDEWLDATARRPEGSQVAFSSLFPFSGEVRYFVPPRTVWPPAPSAKVRWKGARFIPQGVLEAVLQGRPLNEDRWSVDGESECLVASGRLSPFRIALRSAAAVDRVTGANAIPHQSACLEFGAGSGLWCAVAFADRAARDQWNEPVRAAFRLLADCGFGGERSAGWGRAETPEFRDGTLPGLVFPMAANADTGRRQYWILSLFSPRAEESVDWAQGNYHVVRRSGRVESAVNAGAEKKSVDMIAEGSVVVSAEAPAGRAPDVGPDGHPHPVFQAGFALAIAIPDVKVRPHVPTASATSEAAADGGAETEPMPQDETQTVATEPAEQEPVAPEQEPEETERPAEREPAQDEPARDEPDSDEPGPAEPPPDEPTPGVGEP